MLQTSTLRRFASAIKMQSAQQKKELRLMKFNEIHDAGCRFTIQISI